LQGFLSEEGVQYNEPNRDMSRLQQCHALMGFKRVFLNLFTWPLEAISLEDEGITSYFHFVDSNTIHIYVYLYSKAQ
jgi:hypothetical protein